MALTGIHVTCSPINSVNGASLPGNADWSETLSAAGTTVNSAPNQGSRQLEITAAADSFVAIGPNPNATTGPRFFVPTGTQRNILAFPGDKLAWVAA